MTRQEAEKLRELIIKSSSTLEDKEASEGVELFPKLNQNGDLIKTGTRINWNGLLKRAAVDLWDTAENTPDISPDLWEDVLYKNGIRIIPEIITVGLKFSLDELGWWGDVLYKSKINDNVWTPAAYPDGWEEVIE